jgi:hypothetical protein
MASQKTATSLPSPTYKVESTGTELRMSYGMFNDIMRLIGNVQDVSGLLITDAMTRDLVIRRLFTDNKKSVESTDELISAYEIEISPSELDGILGWVADHSAHFLLSTGRSLTKVMEKYQDQLPQNQKEKNPSLSQSSDGLESSAS